MPTRKQQRRTEKNNIEQQHKSQGFQQEPVAGELNSPAISRELAAYFSLEITPISKELSRSVTE